MDEPRRLVRKLAIELQELLGKHIPPAEIVAMMTLLNNYMLILPSGLHVNDYTSGELGLTIDEASQVMALVLGLDDHIHIKNQYHDRFRVYGSDSFLDLVNATIEHLRMKGVQILDYEKMENNKVDYLQL